MNDLVTIREEDLIESVADALQYISYYHPPDYIRALGRAYELEQSPAARDAIAQILTNSRMCAEGRRPICQDTGIVMVFARVGMNVRWDAQLSFEEMINEGVRRAYLHPDNKLRASIVADPSRHSCPHCTNTLTMPVSWQIGRWPSAHIRLLVRICAIASFAAGPCSAS